MQQRVRYGRDASGRSACSRRGSGRQAPATGLNALLIGVVLVGTVFQLFAMPALLRAFGLHAAWFLVPIMLLQPLHWGLIHEAIHSHLLPRRNAEEFWARLLSVTHWLPFDATRFCHLVHHKYSRHAYDRADQFDGHGPYALAWLRYRTGLLGGVYFLAPDVGSAEVAILLWRYRTGRTEPIFRNYPTEPISIDPKTTKERWWLI
jgi:fatty acid desaturase